MMRDILPKPHEPNTEPRRINGLRASAVGLSALLAVGCGALEDKHGAWEIEVVCPDEEMQPSVKAVNPRSHVEFVCLNDEGVSFTPDSLQRIRSSYDGQSREYITTTEPNIVVEYTYTRAADIIEQTPSMYITQVDADGEQLDSATMRVNNAHIRNIANIDR